MQKERKSETFIRWLTGAGIKHEVKVEIDDTFSAWKTTTTEVVVDFDIRVRPHESLIDFLQRVFQAGGSRDKNRGTLRVRHRRVEGFQTRRKK